MSVLADCSTPRTSGVSVTLPRQGVATREHGTFSLAGEQVLANNLSHTSERLRGTQYRGTATQLRTGLMSDSLQFFQPAKWH